MKLLLLVSACAAMLTPEDELPYEPIEPSLYGTIPLGDSDSSLPKKGRRGSSFFRWLKKLTELHYLRRRHHYYHHPHGYMHDHYYHPHGHMHGHFHDHHGHMHDHHHHSFLDTHADADLEDVLDAIEELEE